MPVAIEHCCRSSQYGMVSGVRSCTWMGTNPLLGNALKYSPRACMWALVAGVDALHRRVALCSPRVVVRAGDPHQSRPLRPRLRFSLDALRVRVHAQLKWTADRDRRHSGDSR